MVGPMIGFGVGGITGGSTGFMLLRSAVWAARTTKLVVKFLVSPTRLLAAHQPGDIMTGGKSIAIGF
jgi:hypothetical protein